MPGRRRRSTTGWPPSSAGGSVARPRRRWRRGRAAARSVPNERRPAGGGVLGPPSAWSWPAASCSAPVPPGRSRVRCRRRSTGPTSSSAWARRVPTPPAHHPLRLPILLRWERHRPRRRGPSLRRRRRALPGPTSPPARRPAPPCLPPASRLHRCQRTTEPHRARGRRARPCHRRTSSGPARSCRYEVEGAPWPRRPCRPATTWPAGAACPRSCRHRTSAAILRVCPRPLRQREALTTDRQERPHHAEGDAETTASATSATTWPTTRVSAPTSVLG